ncbi:phospholipid carrier-dependent glycosyltransferase [Candidatus Amarobacter glycogenicus]|uniref:phospholipid carrier-dependent glycosyltransferase n=1 Tax=Candidatus Amarobacter glycogenicus TaxID=3140699 RepID=UPI002A0D4A5E|nr:phospholipid carrier-dependent glycosyltransferase [Dehalococcoidia bacterium]
MQAVDGDWFDGHLVGWCGPALVGVGLGRLSAFSPDERYIHWVATIERPSSLRAAFDPQQSTLNPYYWPPEAASAGIEVLQDTPRRFAYGHLPMYLGVAATRLAEWAGARWANALPPDWLLTRDILNASGMVEYRHLAAVTRALTGLVDLGTIVFVFLLGRRVYGTAVGLLAAAFLALNVMHIQLAHFFTVDPYLTFFTVGTIYFISDFGFRISDSGADLSFPRPIPRARLSFLLAAVFAGLAVGTKFSAVLLFVPLGVGSCRCWRTVVALVGNGRAGSLSRLLSHQSPAVLDWSCEVVTPAMSVGPLTIPEINWASCYLDNITAQSVMVGGGGDIPFTRQYEGTLPLPHRNAAKMGHGRAAGSRSVCGFGWAVWELIRRLKIREIGDLGDVPSANRQSPISSSFPGPCPSSRSPAALRQVHALHAAVDAVFDDFCGGAAVANWAPLGALAVMVGWGFGGHGPFFTPWLLSLSTTRRTPG